MIRNLFFLILGTFSGLCFIWPQIITKKGWECTQDVVTYSDEELTDIESLPNKIKLGIAISPKILLKRESLTRIEKLRIIGDTCFR